MIDFGPRRRGDPPVLGQQVPVPRTDSTIALPLAKFVQVLQAPELVPGLWTVGVRAPVSQLGLVRARVEWSSVGYTGKGAGNSRLEVDVRGSVQLAVAASIVQVSAAWWADATVPNIPGSITVEAWCAPGPHGTPKPLTWSSIDRVLLPIGSSSNVAIPPGGDIVTVRALAWPLSSAYKLEFLNENQDQVLEVHVASGQLCPELPWPSDAAYLELTETGGAAIARTQVQFGIQP